MIAIVAVDKNWGIGYGGNLLQRIPEDMKRFRRMTLGKVVIMGRETFDSFPGKEPLKDRVNIVLTRNEGFFKEGVIVCHSVEELLEEVKKYPWEDVFVIGGDSVYRQLLPWCSVCYVTKIENEYPADRYFVNLDREKDWTLKEAGGPQVYNGITYTYTAYERAVEKGYERL